MDHLGNPAIPLDDRTAIANAALALASAQIELSTAVVRYARGHLMLAALNEAEEVYEQALCRLSNLCDLATQHIL